MVAIWVRQFDSFILGKRELSKFNQFDKKIRSVYLDQSDSITTDKKAAFGNASIEIRIVFDMKST